MKIPKKIKVGATVFTVEIVDEIEKDWSGLTTHSDLIIKIKSGKKMAMEHTFYHELFHALQGGMDEVLVEALAGRLHSFIKDNPGVFK